MKNDRNKVIILIIVAVIIAVMPFVVLKGKNAEFGGTDDMAGGVIESIDKDYTPWAEPIIEKAIGSEIPGEVESLLFCIQTAIGVGIISFYMGRFYERKKHM
jgi:cobalt/nickel transport protein